MATAADIPIQALRVVHEDLAARVNSYADADLGRPSGAAEWTVAQVLSHLGSGAEISLAGLAAARGGAPAPEQSFSQSVWDRWNAMTPRQQADECVSGDATLVAAFEALDGATRSSLRLKLGFLPEPIGADLLAALRLNETTLHGWDVAVADDPAATLDPAAVPVLLDALTGPLSSFLGFLGRGAAAAAVLDVHAVDPDRRLTLRVDDGVSLQPSESAESSGSTGSDATLTLPAEALLRLMTGRLDPDHTPVGVSTTGAADLAALRAAFPGF